MKTKEEKTASKAILAKKRDKVISSLLMIIVGIVLLIWPNPALNLLCRIVGAALCVGGIAAVITYFVSKEKGFALTAAMAAGVIVAFLGFWIFLNPGVLAALIPAIIGAFIIISGIINLSEAVTIHRERGSGMAATLVIAAVTIALGVIVFLRPQWTNAFLVRLIGIALLFDGVSDIWVISKISGKVKEIRADLQAPDGKATDENGDHVAAKAYAPDNSPEARAEEPEETVQDAEVKPLKSFFRKDKAGAEQNTETALQEDFGHEPENFTETHSYTTTTVKRPAHVHEDKDSAGAGPTAQGQGAGTKDSGSDSAVEDSQE